MADTGRFIDASSETYHGDLLDGSSAPPALSASIAKLIVTESEWHAWCEHPRLGNRREVKQSAKDDGKILHALIYGEPLPSDVVQTAHKEFRTNEAKAERDAAIASGKVPLRAGELDWHRSGADKVRSRLPFTVEDVVCEQSISWTDEGVLCRSRLDTIEFHGNGTATIWDPKFYEDINPRRLGKQFYANGIDIEAHAHVKALEAARPDLVGRVEFRPVLISTKTWHVVPQRIAGSMRELGARRWADARERWRRCLETKHWPYYQPDYIEAPTYALYAHGGSD